MNDHAGADRWALPGLTVGEFAPAFVTASRTNPKFYFSTLAGRYVLLAFMPREPARRAAALSALEAVQPLFDGRRLACFLVATDEGARETTVDTAPGLRWFFDPENAGGPLFQSGDAAPGWLLFDPMLRLLARAPLEAPQPLFASLATLPPLAAHAGIAMVAPVLICPRVFEPEFCRRLIDHYDAEGGELSGVMRDIDGKTVGVLDSMKKRRDVNLGDEAFKREVVDRLERSLLPMIARTFQFHATRIERYLIACYDAVEGGWFQPHRDNETFGTAHRRGGGVLLLDAARGDAGHARAALCLPAVPVRRGRQPDP